MTAAAAENDPERTVRRARWAVGFVFLASGVLLGSWAPHVAVVQARLEVGPATLGLALLWMAVGGLVAMPLAGRLTARFGSAPVAAGGSIAYALMLPVAVLAPNLGQLVLGLALFGVAGGFTDVAMNAHAYAVERRLGRPVMSSMHGMWSAGGLIGAGLAGPVLAVLPPLGHMALVVAALGVGLLVFIPGLLPAATDQGATATHFRLPKGATLILGGLAFLAMMSEGAVLDWSAVYLASERGADPTLAAMGFALFSAAMTLGRFTGDRLRQRFGRVVLVRVSGLAAGGGLLIASLVPLPSAALLGFLLLGFGLSNLVPLIFLAAAEGDDGLGPGERIAAVATVGYTGFLVGPPVIGFIGEASSLATGLGLLAAGCLAITLAAGRFRT